MPKRERFFEAIKNDMTATLATASGARVSMRVVSPVYHDGRVLIFTDSRSKKYRQLKENPHGCLAAGGFFAEVTAEFMGPTMLEDNRALRDVYSEKFPGAFAEGVAFGGRDAEFIVLRPTRLSGWAFEGDAPTPDGIPTVPFDIALD